MKHSEFSPSKAHRWLNCPMSIELEKGLPDTCSSYATEGTLAHKVCENIIKNRGKITLKDEGITEEMKSCCIGYYYNFIHSNPIKYWLECEVDLSCIIPNTKGYCDLVLVDKNAEVKIIDFKYGAGVKVEAQDNEQLIMYAIGVVNKLKVYTKTNNWEDTKVHIQIYQPRINNISTYTTTVKELLDRTKIYQEAYRVANDDKLTYLKAGIKQCKFCKAKAKCPELLSILKKVRDIMNKDLITDKDVVFILNNAKIINEFITNVETQALKDALKGEKIEGYKVVEGRSVRTYNSNAEYILKAKLGDKAYNKKVIGITEASKVLDKETMESITFKPQGKPTLVKESDKRQEYGAITESMFDSK